MSNPCEVVYAPYNFVPLAPAVYLPSWAGQARQDRPFADGISGTIPLRIEARAPLLVGGRRNRAEGRPIEIEFVAAPDGARTPFIPGSSLRGLIRAVIEIAGFGRMRYVDDRRFAFRDVTATGMGQLYRKRMTDTVALETAQGRKETAYVPKVKAGWLLFDAEGRWTITPCGFARIEQFDVLGRIQARTPYQAATKYKAVDFPRKSLERDVEIEPRRAHRHSSGYLGYAKATLAKPGSKTARRGMLVFTGQPNDRKHMEFVFHDPEPQRRLRVPDEVMAAFRAIHTADPQRANTRGRAGGLQETDIDSWRFWTDPRNARAAPGIPVFYLTDAAGAVESLGLSMMYKLPYRAGVHDLLRRHGGKNGTDGPHLAEGALDLADTLFGHVRAGADGAEEANGTAALKGRVSFGHAKVVGPARTTRQPAAILSAPKPSYLPSYIAQPLADASGRLPQDKNTRYSSYEDDGSDGSPVAQLRGWKRYPVRRDARPQQIPPTLTDQTAIQSVLNTLNPGTRFVGEMRLHNVRPAELGALLFALRLSQTFEENRPERWHALGLGKPFGFGAVVLDTGVTAESWGEASLVPNDPGRPLLTPEDCVATFVKEMNGFCSGAKLPAWGQSPQILALLAMAEPDRVTSGSLEMEQRNRDDVVTSGGKMGETVLREGPLRQTVGYGPAHPLASMPLQDFGARKKAVRALPDYLGRAPTPAARPVAATAARPSQPPPQTPRNREGFRFLRGDAAYVDGERCTVLEDVSEQAYSRNLVVQIRIDGNTEPEKAQKLRPARE